jgi:hypothetical protein
MAISSTASRVSYSGNGSTTAFSFPYYFLTQSDLIVIVRNSTTGVETIKALTTHYTISGATNSQGAYISGGTVTMLVAPAAGESLVIYRDPSITQQVDLVENDSSPAETIEQEFDRLTMISQRLSNRLDRAVRLSDGFSPSFDPTLPVDLDGSGGKVPLVNLTGNGFDLAANWPTIDNINNAQTYAGNAATSASDASDSATLASNWATQLSSAVAGGEWSAKAHAIGGTGGPSTGAAKDWATKTSSNVDGTEYSAKEYAQGTQASTGGSAKDWAQKTSAAVTGTSYSAQEWAVGIQTRGSAGGGSAKDWANYIGGTVDNTEFSAKKYATDSSTSATASAASATAAANTLASALWRDVVFLTSASSPKTIAQADNGVLFVCDTTAGAIVINLPTIAGITLPLNFGVKLEAGLNQVTINRGGTDTIDGATSKTLAGTSSGCQLIADTDPVPDAWTAIDFGAVAGNLSVNVFSGDGSTTAFALSVSPGSVNNTFVSISGILQQKSTYSLSGSTLTFVTAPPSGTNNIEAVSGTVLSLGVPSDGTVTRAKLNTSSAFIPPTIQKFTSGSGTYTTPANAMYIRVRMVGGGGGGAGSGTAAGGAVGNGGNTTFGTTLLVANGGTGGAYAGHPGGVGGTASLGTGPIGIATTGQTGQGYTGATIDTVFFPGGQGGASPFGGAGTSGAGDVGTTAIANTGSGGGGGGTNGGIGAGTNRTGAGGGAGGFVDALISSPSATYSYAVGASGTAGTSGTSGQAGGAGAAGYIEVIEYYQ